MIRVPLLCVLPCSLCSVWVMHAMLLLANAAGLAFVPHLKHLLGLAQGMLLSGGWKMDRYGPGAMKWRCR